MRRRALTISAIVLLALIAATAGATWQLSRPKFAETASQAAEHRVRIAPHEEAVTLARLAASEGGRVLLVTEVHGERVVAVDLEDAIGRSFRDAVEAAETLGTDGLRAAARRGVTFETPLSNLALPVDFAYPHIAAGTNYRAHAEEVGHDEGPFLFPKLAHATPWNADVASRGRFDYEAEVCAVTLDDHSEATPARLGYLLCNDFTDRWQLVREIDLDAAMGTTGFPDAKGGDGMLTVGPFLVVPDDAERFYRGLRLELWVDDELRQRESADRMIWSPAAIADRALDACHTEYTTAAGSVPLVDCAGIPARTLLLTGTPGGVAFHLVTLWAPWAYLQPGDEVVTFEPRLGVLRNRIR